MLTDPVRTDRPLAIISSPQGPWLATDWLATHDLGFALDNRYLVYVRDAYDAWKFLGLRKSSSRDIVIRAYDEGLDLEEKMRASEITAYLNARGWWVV